MRDVAEPIDLSSRRGDVILPGLRRDREARDLA